MRPAPEIGRSLRGIGRFGRAIAVVVALVGGTVLLVQGNQLAADPVRWLARLVSLALICGGLWSVASLYLHLADRK